MAFPLDMSAGARKGILADIVGHLGSGMSLAAAARSLAPMASDSPESAGGGAVEGESPVLKRSFALHRIHVYGSPFVRFK